MTARWPAAALVVGVCGLATTFAPYPAGLAGIAAGVVGIGGGVVGINHSRRSAARMLPAAASAIVVSVVAVATGVTMVFVDPPAANPVADESSAEVLRDELDVAVGTFTDADPDAKHGRLPVTFTNKLGETTEFAVALAAFGGEGHQIDSQTVQVVLAAESSEDQDLFTLSTPELLKAASFRVIAAHKVIRRHR